MANSHITTGKYIYELVDLGTTLKEDAVFPVAQDSLTRKVEARVFRKFINGDNDEPSDELYYSSQKIDELLGNQSDIIDNINEEINNINNRIDNLIDVCRLIRLRRRLVQQLLDDVGKFPGQRLAYF